MNLKKQAAVYAGLAFLIAGNVGQSEGIDPKAGMETYYGSGYVENAPEYAEVFFKFEVGCRKSPKDVRKAIEEEAGSAKIWKAIEKHVVDDTEKNRRYQGNVTNIRQQPGSYLEIIQPSRNSLGKLVRGSTRRLSTCEDKELKISDSLASVFSGQQTFGVRSQDMDWVEGLVKTVSELPQGKGRLDVKTQIGRLNGEYFQEAPILYNVTSETRREMQAKVRAQARERATGKGSVLESDLACMWENVHYTDARRVPAPLHGILMGRPIKRGESPKVTMQLPFVYTIYAETSDLKDSRNKLGDKPSSTPYEVIGTGVDKADFAEALVSVRADCQTTGKAAAAAIKVTASAIETRLDVFQGKMAASETDRVMLSEDPVPTQDYPYTAVKWDESNPALPVVEYRDNCTGKPVTAPKSGRLTELPTYWSVRQAFTVKSSDFAGILNLVEELQDRYAVSSADPAAVVVQLSDPIGQATKATLGRLHLMARQDATQCVINPDGELANDADSFKFQCAHVTSIRIESRRPSNNSFERAKLGGSAPEAIAEAGPGGLQSGKLDDGLDVTVVKKDGEKRPRITMGADYGFDYEVVSKNLLPDLKAEAEAPLP